MQTKDDFLDYITSRRCYEPIKKDSLLISDFFRKLKNQKLFGYFISKYSINELSYSQKIGALDYVDETRFEINDITIFTNMKSSLIRRLILLSEMISGSYYNDRCNEYPIGISKILAAYIKEYAKEKGFKVKHTVIYYQFLFGIISVVLGLSMLYFLIYHICGGYILAIVMVLIFVYSLFGFINFKKAIKLL